MIDESIEDKLLKLKEKYNECKHENKIFKRNGHRGKYYKCLDCKHMIYYT